MQDRARMLEKANGGEAVRIGDGIERALVWFRRDLRAEDHAVYANHDDRPYARSRDRAMRACARYFATPASICVPQRPCRVRARRGAHCRRHFVQERVAEAV